MRDIIDPPFIGNCALPPAGWALPVAAARPKGSRRRGRARLREVKERPACPPPPRRRRWCIAVVGASGGDSGGRRASALSQLWASSAARPIRSRGLRFRVGAGGLPEAGRHLLRVSRIMDARGTIRYTEGTNRTVLVEYAQPTGWSRSSSNKPRCGVAYAEWGPSVGNLAPSCFKNRAEFGKGLCRRLSPLASEPAAVRTRRTISNTRMAPDFAE